MKNKYHILLILFLSSISANYVCAADYYPELGIDPFYSSLNPTYINKQDTTENEVTLINLFKKKNKNKSKNEKLEEENIIESIENNTNSDTDIKKDNSSDNKETFVTQPKKHLTKKELEKELRKEEKEREKAKLKAEEEAKVQEETTTLKDNLFFFKKKKKSAEKEAEQKTPEIEISADYMEYYPDRYEIEAIGNAKVEFKSKDLILSAYKIVFNYDRNILRATENVELVSNGSITEGDFIKLELNKPNGWIENPITTTEDIKLSAKEAFIYTDRIEEYNGTAKIYKDDIVNFGARSFAAYVDQSHILQSKIDKIPEESKGVYKLKAKTIIIDSEKDHEIINIKNADLYLKNKKIATIPSFKLVTNKDHASVETNMPEFGSQRMLGMHIGPAVVLNVPGGSTLKVAPLLTYSKDKFGFGALGRFRNASNMTEVAYGTSKEQLVIRGRQKLAPGFLLTYSRFTHQNEWFLGYRMPKYSANLSYSRSDYVKDLKLHFSQMYSAGLFVDNNAGKKDLSDTEGRFRWMTQTYKPVYKYFNEEGNVGVNLGLVAQTSATVYTTGDTRGIFRFGPALTTKVGPWQQSVMLFQGAIAGQSPFEFDRYRYGRTNAIIIQSLKVCKYLSLGYLTSLAMNRDYKDDELLQENRLLVSIGPDYAKITLGYDAIRRNTMFVFSMLVGTKDSDITFKKTIVNNPERLGKKSKDIKKKHKKRSYKKYLKQAPKHEDFN